MPKLTHPDAKVPFEAPDKVVPFWLRAGWALADGESAPQPPPVLVLSRVKADAERYAREAGLDRWRYAADDVTVLDVGPDRWTLAVLPGFEQHRHHDAIVAQLAAAGFDLSPVTEAGVDDSTGGRDLSATSNQE